MGKNIVPEQLQHLIPLFWLPGKTVFVKDMEKPESVMKQGLKEHHGKPRRAESMVTDWYCRE